MKTNSNASTEERITLTRLFFTLLKIGSVSWGGFMALISVLQKQFADKDRVIDNEEILDGIALAGVLPGPMAFNVVTYIGYKLKGLKGAFVSMAGILIPSFILMIILSYLYFSYGNIPAVNSFFKGIYPAIAAIILSVAISMSKKNITDIYQFIIALSALLLIVFIKSFFITMLVILSGGLAGYILYRNKTEDNSATTVHNKKPGNRVFLFLSILVLFITLLVFLFPYLCNSSNHNFCLIQQKISIIFSGLSVSLFGGGYVVIPMLENIFVQQLGWLSLKEFTDGIALGQVTPGPIFISATFIGFKTGGFLGALNATLFIFVPPGLLMILFSHFIERIKHSSAIQAMFKGLRPAVIGMIFSAVYTIGKGSEIGWISLIIFSLVLILIMYYKINAVYMIPLAGITGIIFYQMIYS